MKMLIRIPSHETVWRYDQIAGVELVESTVSVFIVGSPMTEAARRDYEYDNEEEAEKAFVELLELWKGALAQ